MKSQRRLENMMYFTFAVALIATLGSLFFSEVKGIAPCTLCWFIRILMYPLVMIASIAAVRRDFKQSLYMMTFSALGVGLASYHYLLQKTNIFGNDAGNACGQIPCNLEYINVFGFITIPFLALIAFIMIFMMQFYVWKKHRE